jgi:ribosome recycling factor
MKLDTKFYEEKMKKTISTYSENLSTIRAGRANPHVLDKILVEAYGGTSPINQIGNVSVSDGQCLVISPWDKSLLKSVEKAIQLSNIGINPTNDGNVIRLVFPMLTDERRREIVKQVKAMGENGKVAIRNIRRDGLDAFKKLKNAKEITEDQYSQYEAQIEKTTAKIIEAVDKVISEKEKELLTL